MQRLSNLPLRFVPAARVAGAGAALTLALALTLAPVPPAAAHHSVAAYDRAHPVTITGTVQRFRFINPHVRISLSVPDGKGGEQVIELIGGTLAAVARDGLTAHTLHPGQKVTLLVAPRKHGSEAADNGEWQRVLEVDGRPFTAARAGIAR